MMVTKHWSGALPSLQQCTPHSLKASGAACQGEKHKVLDPVKVTLSTGHTRSPIHPLTEDGLQFFLGFLIPQPGNMGGSALDFSAAETCLHWTSIPSNFGPSLADLLCSLACL